jgi:WD40 repeat protein
VGFKSVAWGGDGRHLAAIDGKGSVTVWETQSWTEVAKLSGLNPSQDGSAWRHAGQVTWIGDGKWLAATATGQLTQLVVWQAGSWKKVFQHTASPEYSVHFDGWNRDGRQVMFQDEQARLRIWDPIQGETEVPYILSPSSTEGRLIPDGIQRASARGNDIEVTDSVSSPVRHLQFRGHGGRVWQVAWSPDRRRLVSIAGGLIIWDVESGQEMLTIPGDFSSIAFSPDSSRLAVGQAGTVTIWGETRCDSGE